MIIPGSGRVGAVRSVHEAFAGGCLRLVLADLDDGLVGLGRHSARGYGTVRVDDESYRSLPGLAEAQAVLRAMPHTRASQAA